MHMIVHVIIIRSILLPLLYAVAVLCCLIMVCCGTIAYNNYYKRSSRKPFNMEIVRS